MFLVFFSAVLLSLFCSFCSSSSQMNEKPCPLRQAFLIMNGWLDGRVRCSSCRSAATPLLSFCYPLRLVQSKRITTAAERSYTVPRASPSALIIHNKEKPAETGRLFSHSVSNSSLIPLSSSTRDGSRSKYSTRVSIQVIESRLR